jgi:hypothetical protein
VFSEAKTQDHLMVSWNLFGKAGVEHVHIQTTWDNGKQPITIGHFCLVLFHWLRIITVLVILITISSSCQLFGGHVDDARNLYWSSLPIA